MDATFTDDQLTFAEATLVVLTGEVNAGSRAGALVYRGWPDQSPDGADSVPWPEQRAGARGAAWPGSGPDRFYSYGPGLWLCALPEPVVEQVTIAALLVDVPWIEALGTAVCRLC